MKINKTKHRFVTWNLINEIRTPISWQLRLPFITGTNEMNTASPVILKLSSLQIAALQTQRDSTAIQLWYTGLNQWTLVVLITDYLLITKHASGLKSTTPFILLIELVQIEQIVWKLIIRLFVLAYTKMNVFFYI